MLSIFRCAAISDGRDSAGGAAIAGAAPVRGRGGESIVERASKELVTERILAELEATWAEIAFEHSLHQRTGYRCSTSPNSS
ncbi:hypothetical protein CEXT_440471 [Caerostris extrusa]|uniref:Transposase n=1 Tax=Caerostris extrusa TaxID=172846 RepID=A0AAV4V7Y4_CAEEX|nr:hypothetical protein CEXT_440471 [Caerostris extrusa]